MGERASRVTDGAADVVVGARVVAADGDVGVVREVLAGADGYPTALVVALHDGGAVEVPLTVVERVGPDEVRLAISRSALIGGLTSPQGDEVVRLALHEEIVEAEAAPVQRGTVRIVRRVETIPVADTVQTWQEVVEVERVPINREIATAPGPRTEGDVIIIPVVEEIVVTETRLVLREEVHVRRRRVAEQVQIAAEVRREVVDVVQEPLTADEPLRGAAQ
jgi:uncharacterized protein (TIGR02271 family)